jgi:hypothetical protein
MIQCINSFSQVKIKPKSLVVLDIDDTILNFPSIRKGWWTDTFNNYYEQEQDYDRAEELALNDWVNIIANDKAQLLDPINFETFLNKIREQNCELILLTARNDKLRELTKKHLADCKLDIPHNKIYHNRNKGKKLLELVKNVYNNVSQIIFVDDLESNLNDVEDTFLSYSYDIVLYHINH